MKQSLRVLLDSLIDYAGLFPPAALPLEDALANYRRYREGEFAWMLGRFVVPLAQSGEVPAEFPKSVVAREDEIARLPESIDAIEVKAADRDAVFRIASATATRTAFIEVADAALVAAIASCPAPAAVAAKIRTGGITADAFPSAAHVATFLRICAMEGVAFKATAGLHHPVRCIRPMTYEPDAPTGTMHGFINTFMAAALLNDAEHVLVEEDPSAFSFEDDFAAWRGKAVSVEHLRRVRTEFAISFGSCSFEEPIEDMRALGWM